MDEKTWEKIMKYIVKKYKVPYGKYRKLVINEVLELGIKKIAESDVEEFKKILKEEKISEDFLTFLEKISKEIRKRGVRRYGYMS